MNIHSHPDLRFKIPGEAYKAIEVIWTTQYEGSMNLSRVVIRIFFSILEGGVMRFAN
jgi:hypothetical protein